MASARQLPAGTIIAQDFRVLCPLAVGGMGALYVVEQLSTGAERALKVMHARLAADPRSRQRFLQEARASGRIESDHVVQVISAGVDDASGTPWIVMELLKGRDLRATLDLGGKLPLEEASTVLRQLGHALSAAHKVGLVHRDVKPENIFLANPRRGGAAWVVKLLDFGISRVLEEASLGTTSALGSPLWMAPEQAVQGALSPACDVWAYGLVAYTTLTARSYWNAGNQKGASMEAMLRELLAEPMPAPSTRAEPCGVTLPAGFDGWFARCTERTPAQRFGDAGAALAALEAVLSAAEKSVKAKPPEVFGTGRTPVQGSAQAPREVHPTPAGALPAVWGPAGPTPAPRMSEVVAPAAFAAAPPGALALPPTGPGAPPPSAVPNPPTVLAAPTPAASRTVAWAPGQPVPPNLALYGAAGPSGGRASAPTPTPKGHRGLWAVVVGVAMLGVAIGTVAFLASEDDRPRRPRRPRRPAPGAPAAPSTLGVGWTHACALGPGGSVQCWGYSAFGALGDGTVQPRGTPAPVAGLAGAVEVVSGAYHACARLSDGTARCWGLGTSGQLGEGGLQSRSTPTAVAGLGGIAQLVAGEGHTCARRAQGTVTCWGANQHGQLGDGSVTDRVTPVEVPGLGDVVELSAGDEHTCARLREGTLRCWGSGTFGQLGNDLLGELYTPTAVARMDRVVSLSAGAWRTCAVREDGRVWCWGRNDAGQGGDGTTLLRTAASQVLGLTDAVSVRAGPFHTCALRAGGAVACWGVNDQGALGDGTTQTRSAPVAVQGVARATDLCLGENFTCARSAAGVQCWGANGQGQLGDGTAQDRPSPGPAVLR
ncbi:MAG: protein kinase [Deltaproteobacteria bacterium]|nr:protein kinase [Deltaproteobacteria bacterium]